MTRKVTAIVSALACIACTQYIDGYSTIHNLKSASKNRLEVSPKIPSIINGEMVTKQRDTRKRSKPSHRGWHRRLWSKVLFTRSEGISANMVSSEAYMLEQDKNIPYRYLQAQDAFILGNFESESPETFYHGEATGTMALPLVEMRDDKNTPSEETGSPFVRITRKTFEKVLTERLDKWSKGVNTNLIVECDPTSSVLQFLRGHFYCDATINLDRIVFGNFQISGGQLQARNFCLNLFSFAPITIPMAASPRYPNQFDLIAQNLTFTQEDLWESSCIRNGLRRLMTRILKQKGLSAMNVSLQSIQILPNGKLSCTGEATSLFAPTISFELRTGLGLSGRGHILTLPGLEIAINPVLGFFVPVIPDLTIDLGHNAQLLDIVIDEENTLLKVSACVTITPEHTLQLKEYIQSSNAYGAHCFVDVGRWLTKVGRFAH
jgi:hypothetical protein